MDGKNDVSAGHGRIVVLGGVATIITEEDVMGGEHGKGGAGYSDGADDVDTSHIDTELRRAELIDRLPDLLLFLLDAAESAHRAGVDDSARILLDFGTDISDTIHVLKGDYERR